MAEVEAFVFEGKKTAGKALDAAVEADAAGYGWLEDVAVLSRSKHGFLRVDSTWAQDDSSVAGGVGWGALTGGLIGALAGPQGAVAGALGGGATGGLIGTGIDIAVADPRLEDFAESLENDTSALVLVGVSPATEAFVSTFTPYGGTLYAATITDEELQELQDAL